MDIKINGWVAVLVIGGLIVGISAYTVKAKGLPMKCFKHTFTEVSTPSNEFKAVSYHFDCRQTIAGLDLGPYGWAVTGVDIVSSGSTIGREGLPPLVYVVYKEENRKQANREIPPAVRFEWKGNVDLNVFHDSSAKTSYPFNMIRQFKVHFKEEGA